VDGVTGEDLRSGPATAILRATQAVPVAMREHTRELAKLSVPRDARKQGHASELMRQACDRADRKGWVLLLWPQPWGDVGMTRQQLIDWYSRGYGFIRVQDEPPLMARRPLSGFDKLNPMAAAVHQACA
jgi:predicted GNAT family acetyltransferase